MLVLLFLLLVVQNPPTAMAMAIDGTSGTRIYGTGFYNWFNGQQGPMFSVTRSPDIQQFGSELLRCL